MERSITLETMKCSGATYSSTLVWVLLSLSVVLLPTHFLAAASPSLDNPEQASTSSAVVRGIVTLTSNLRGAPSMQGEVVGIIREGLPVDILTETGAWYFIRTNDGLEAWIYKPLVVIDPATEPQSDVVDAPPDTPLTETDPQDEPPTEPVDAPEVAAQEQALPQEAANPPVGQLVPAAPIPLSPEQTVVSEPDLVPLRGLVVYLVAALVLVVLVSSWLQWRASRQLRRALGQMGHLLHVVEDIYDKAAEPRSARLQVPSAAPRPLPVAALPAAVIEFSPVERALLEGLTSGGDVQESELAKILQEKGFPGVLIKAVVGEIVRKTAGDGQPWIEVTYTHGRYAYALRPTGEDSRRGVRQRRDSSP